MKLYLSDITWRTILHHEMEKPYFRELESFLERRARAGAELVPQRAHIFKALELCAPETCKVVIIGQDPYPTNQLATGVAFGVPRKIIPANYPPTLKNIFRRLRAEYDREPMSGDLGTWGYSGVLLLNRVLTTEEGARQAHRGKGWEEFTEAVVKNLLNYVDRPIAFMLWGNEAQQLEEVILPFKKHQPHLILKTSHPSPLSVHKGFLFYQQFRKVNEFLTTHGYQPIDWLFT